MDKTTIVPLNNTTSHCIHGSLTGPLGIIVQASLAAIAFSALIVKRYCEPIKTRRPWGTWWLDTSKQAVGAGFIHMANVYISEVLFSGDPCTWYIISFLLDSTIGLFFIIICLKISLRVIIRFNFRMLLFGNYDPPSACTSWFYQCLIYVSVIAVEKILITFLTLLPFWTKLSSWMLHATSNANLELFIVMFLVPLIVNALIFWVTDNYLKLHHVPASNHHHRRYKLFEGEEEEENDVVSNGFIKPNSQGNSIAMVERNIGRLNKVNSHNGDADDEEEEEDDVFLTKHLL